MEMKLPVVVQVKFDVLVKPERGMHDNVLVGIFMSVGTVSRSDAPLPYASEL
jgi:hypothetical protein